MEWLKTWGIKTPLFFEYCSTRMALAAVSALLLTIFLGKPFIQKLYEQKIGDRVRSEYVPLLSELHRNKKDTPTMGGLLILLVLLAVCILFINLKSIFALILMSTAAIFGSIGAYDDLLKLKYKNKKGLSARKKMVFISGFSIIVGLYLLFPAISEMVHHKSWFAPPIAKDAERNTPISDLESKENTKKQAPDALKDHLSGINSFTRSVVLSTYEYSRRLYIPFIKDPLKHLSAWFMILVVAFVITGTSNAVNLTDGLDGLATGTMIMASTAFALIAFVSNNSELSGYLNILYIEGSGEIAVFLSAVMGACLGFLWYNSHPAQVFMGDTGSLALGGVLGVSAVLLKKEILLAIIGGVFVMEALSVIIQVGSYKLRNKKRVFLCTPLHHHFEYKGWPETKVVMRFWIVGLLLAIIGIASLKFQ